MLKKFKEKHKILFYLLFAVFAFYCSCLSLQGLVISYIVVLRNYTFEKRGIDNFDRATGSHGLNRYITFFEFPYKNPEFIYGDYRFKEEDYGYKGLNKDTSLLYYTYSDDNFAEAVSVVENEVGFEKSISWQYGNYVFNLNTSDIIDCGELDQMTDYNFNGNKKSIKWINFVGISKTSNTICFCGINYFRGLLRFGKGFSFTDWEELYTEFFPYFDWNEKGFL